ncbi:MAG: alpha/beta hydrolase [Rhizobiaceae bacterium]
MPNPKLEREYALDHLQPEVNYLPAWKTRSAAFRATAQGQVDLSYGVSPRDRLDYFPAANAGSAPTLIFIHGGWWQRGDKSFYSFLAEPFLAKGISFAAINYDFCPHVRISQIVEQNFRSIDWLDNNIDTLGGNREKLVIVGHSAGGHLAGMMTTTDAAPGARRLRRGMLKGAVLLSGLFDLEPLLEISVNDLLRLVPEEARAHSPIKRGSSLVERLVIGCGQEESAEFNRQSDAYVAARKMAGDDVCRISVTGNHFDIINELGDPDSPLFQTTVQIATV